MASHIELQIPSQMKMDDGKDGDSFYFIFLSFYKKHLIPFILYFLAHCVTVSLAMVILYKAKSIGIPSKTLKFCIIAFSPSYMTMMALCLPKSLFIGRIWIEGVYSESRLLKGMEGVYSESRSKFAADIGRILTSFGLLARVGVLITWWLALNVLIPRLKSLTLLGSPLWIWSLLALTITSAYFGALLLLKMLVTVCRLWALFWGSISGLFLLRGLFPSMSFVLYFGSVLGVWVGYFSTERGLKQASTPHHVAFEYVTWTCVSFFVGSILCFLKTLFLLKWRANAIYKRFEPRILITGVKYFYLGLIVGGFLNPMVIKELELLKEFARHTNLDTESFSLINYIMSQHLDTAYLANIGRTLTALAQAVRPLEEDGVRDLFKFLENKIPNNHMCQPEDLVTTLHCPALSNQNLLPKTPNDKLIDTLQKFIKPTEENDTTRSKNVSRTIGEDLSPEDYRDSIAKVLHYIVREQSASTEHNQFTFDDLKKWMVEAHMNCVNMGCTIADGSAIVTCLDMFISFFIFIAVVLLWLLITGIATTTVLVTIATPLLALTFIFGDSAKAFFQGIIFCFGTHAFDVGDRCILDETELEVKRISIMTTTFIKIGSAEKRMYPNSVLATKAIVNLGWQPDPSDTVELTLDYSTKPTDWQVLEKNVHQFFNDPQHKEMFQSSHEVTMKETGDKIKVTIHFKHVLNIKEMTHGQCFHKKNRQRSIILKRVSLFIDPNPPSRNDGENEGLTSSQVVPTNDLDQSSNTGEITKL